MDKQRGIVRVMRWLNQSHESVDWQAELQSHDIERRRQALGVLEAMGDPSVASAVAIALEQSNDFEFNISATEALGRFGSIECVNCLSNMLKKMHATRELRLRVQQESFTRSATSALARIAAEQPQFTAAGAFIALINALDNPYFVVQTAAAEQLEVLQRLEKFNILSQAINNPSARAKLLVAAGKYSNAAILGDVALQWFERVICSTDNPEDDDAPYRVYSVVRVISLIRSPRSVDLLIKVLERTRIQEEEELIDGICQDIRSAAARALGTLKDPRGIPYLISLLNQTSEYKNEGPPHKAALDALRRIGKPAVTLLRAELTALENKSDPNIFESNVKASIAEMVQKFSQ